MNSLMCLALTLYFESRGEPWLGQIAVAQVVLNRVESSQFPDNVCDVVYEGGEARYKCQFTWYCDGKSDEPQDEKSWAVSLSLASLSYILPDFTAGSLWYHADYVNPTWASNNYLQVGAHKFYGDINAVQEKR